MYFKKLSTFVMEVTEFVKIVRHNLIRFQRKLPTTCLMTERVRQNISHNHANMPKIRPNFNHKCFWRTTSSSKFSLEFISMDCKSIKNSSKNYFDELPPRKKISVKIWNGLVKNLIQPTKFWQTKINHNFRHNINFPSNIF